MSKARYEGHTASTTAVQVITLTTLTCLIITCSIHNVQVNEQIAIYCDPFERNVHKAEETRLGSQGIS